MPEIFSQARASFHTVPIAKYIEEINLKYKTQRASSLQFFDKIETIEKELQFEYKWVTPEDSYFPTLEK